MYKESVFSYFSYAKRSCIVSLTANGANGMTLKSIRYNRGDLNCPPSPEWRAD